MGVLARGCSVRLKRSQQGWFAAGPAFEQVLHAVSDASFKVFAYVCLRAERTSGCLEFERRALARRLGKSEATLGRCLRELASKGICELQAAPNQHRGSRLQIRPEYWPYHGPGAGTGGRSRSVTARGESAGPVTAFVAEVRRMFRQPACVQGVFGPADERLAAEWHRAGVSLETVRRAILLGSARKSLSMLDRPGSEPVQSLRYFERLVEAVRNQSWSATYWEHVELTLERCERTWRQQPGPA